MYIDNSDYTPDISNLDACTVVLHNGCPLILVLNRNDCCNTIRVPNGSKHAEDQKRMLDFATAFTIVFVYAVLPEDRSPWGMWIFLILYWRIGTAGRAISRRRLSIVFRNGAIFNDTSACFKSMRCLKPVPSARETVLVPDKNSCSNRAIHCALSE